MTPLKVAVYYPWVYLHGGPERTIVELLKRTRHEVTVFTSRFDADATFPELKTARIVEVGRRVSVKRTFADVGGAAARIAMEKLPLDGFDVLVVFCEGLGDLVTIRNRGIPTVCLCFTPLRAAYDSEYVNGYLRMKGAGVGRVAALALAGRAFRLLDQQLWRNYEHVIAISEEVRARIAEGGLRRREEVSILYPGIDSAALAPTWEYTPDFLIPGRLMWTKNLELAIQAYQLFQRRCPDLSHFTWTMAGYLDEKSRPYLARLRELAAGTEGIRFVVSPGDRELRELNQRAWTVLYPPFNEDWGLVPLEAMAMGKPVIATARGGPLETIVDGSTGYLVEPTAEEFATAMERVARDPELVKDLGRAARQRALAFDWIHFCVGFDTTVEQAVLARRSASSAA